MKMNLLQGSKNINRALLTRIESVSMDLIYDRLTIKHGWTGERATNAIFRYKMYLYLTQVYGAPISPTKDVDEVWHEHLLHTQKYKLDCEKMFGKFLHHFPTPSRRKKTETKGVVASGFCCNHQNCCNDDPVVDTSRATCLDRTMKPLVVANSGVLQHADCGQPAPGGCAPIGGNDDFCAGTTNDRYNRTTFNFDNPDMSTVPASAFFEDVVGQFFIETNSKY